MRDLDKGHQLISIEKYQEAYDYFTLMKSLYGREEQTLNGSIYGQARALANLNKTSEAEILLLGLIKKVPSWEAPYISLARMYEAQAQTLKEEAQTFKQIEETYNQCIDEAKRLYDLAQKNSKYTKNLTKHYVYFLNVHADYLKDQTADWTTQNTFTPGFKLSQSKPTPTAAVAVEMPSRPKPTRQHS